MTFLVLACVAAAGIAGFVLWRGLTLFLLSIEKGEVRLVRGGIPPALLTEIREIVKIGRVESGSISVVKDGGEAKLVCSSEISDATIQRIRNVLGRFPIAKLRQFRR